MTAPVPRQREVWFVNLEPVIGHEQGRRRPAVVISRDALARSGLVIVVPLTRTDVGSPLHLAIDPPEAGLHERSFALPQQVRAVSTERLVQRLGTVRPQTLAEIARRVATVIRPE